MNNKNIKKPPKKKKAKAERIPFDKIDVTTATEDDIIQSGIRYHTSKDKVCYFIMFMIFILALVPVLLRVSIPKEITEEEMEIVYMKVDCYRTVAREGHELSSILTLNYRNNKIQTADFEFKSNKVDPSAADDYVFSEINELNTVDSSAFVATVEDGKNLYKIDFTKDKSLLEHPALKDYTYVSGPEIEYLRGQRYTCASTSETKTELVDKVTQEKVE